MGQNRRKLVGRPSRTGNGEQRTRFPRQIVRIGQIEHRKLGARVGSRASAQSWERHSSRRSASLLTADSSSGTRVGSEVSARMRPSRAGNEKAGRLESSSVVGPVSAVATPGTSALRVCGSTTLSGIALPFTAATVGACPCGNSTVRRRRKLHARERSFCLPISSKRRAPSPMITGTLVTGYQTTLPKPRSP